MGTSANATIRQNTRNNLRKYWRKNTLGTEYTLHQLSPYIGKLKSSVAKGIILNFTTPGDTLYDPYAGASTIPLEGCILKRHVIANDLNPYAHVLSMAKLHPPKDLQVVLNDINLLELQVGKLKRKVDLRKVPKWIREFFHKETLKEIITWVDLLRESENWFVLSCLLGILHHQRPGFLSFPCSHSVPYLRKKKFPPETYPQLYEYRNVRERLEKKIIRAFRRMPSIDAGIRRVCLNEDASNYIPSGKVDAIITSPPYMRSLDYARDNRLRLWFLDCMAWKNLDAKISPTERNFLVTIKSSLVNWKKCLKESGKCIFILGDNFCSSYDLDLPDTIAKIAVEEVGEYELIFRMRNMIPDKKRVRRNLNGNKYETILVLEKKAYGK